MKEKFNNIPDNKLEQLKNYLAVIAAQINADANKLETENNQSLVNSDCSINMNAFLTESDDSFSKKAITRDQEHIKRKEEEFSGANNENVQAFYKAKYGAGTSDEIVKQYKKSRIKHEGTQVEMVITSILYKILRDKFIVTRASTYDDYENGVDNVIVHKETGEVICAFDEVNDGVDGHKQDEKKKKIVNKAKKNGATIKYAFTVINKDGVPKLQKKSHQNIPTFYLSLTSEKMRKVLDKITFDINHISFEELEIFNDLLNSMKDQAGMLKEQNLKPEINHNIDKFEKLLPEMKF